MPKNLFDLILNGGGFLVAQDAGERFVHMIVYFTRRTLNRNFYEYWERSI